MDSQPNRKDTVGLERGLKHSTTQTGDTPSATSFFFKANPKHVLSTVKRVLSPSSKETDNGNGNIEEREGMIVRSKGALLTSDQLPSSTMNSTPEVIEIASDDDHESNSRKKRSKIIDLSDEDDNGNSDSKGHLGREYATTQSKLTRRAAKRSSVTTERSKPMVTLNERTVVPLNMNDFEGPERFRKGLSSAAVGDPCLPDSEIDPLLLKYALPPKAISSLASTTTLPPKKYKMTIQDDFPYHFGDRKKHITNRDDSIWTRYRRHCEEKRLGFHSIVLTYNGTRLFQSATPASLGIVTESFTIVALPEAEYKQREDERVHRRTRLLNTLWAGARPESNDEQSSLSNTQVLSSEVPLGYALQLVFKCPTQALESWSTSVIVDQPLTKVIPDLRSALGLDSDTDIRLYFDGVLLDTSQSPQQLQLEDDDLIDVRTVKDCS